MLDKLIELFAPRDVPRVDDGPKRVQIATCVLMLEVAYADTSFSENERARIQETLKARFQLDEDEGRELMDLAEDARQESHDIWRFTNRINQACSPDEKRAIIREVWRIVYADGELSSHEDHLIHRMATLLNLTHRQLIAEKMTVLDELRGTA